MVRGGGGFIRSGILSGCSVSSPVFTSFNEVRRDLDMLVRWGKIGENLTLLLRGDCEKDRSGGAWGSFICRDG